MVKVINKQTGVVKELTQALASMYLSTNEWELYLEKKESKEKPIFSKEK